jgi:hypothetical protein
MGRSVAWSRTGSGAGRDRTQPRNEGLGDFGRTNPTGRNPATVALQRETRTIPIVFAGVSDPVATVSRRRRQMLICPSSKRRGGR